MIFYLHSYFYFLPPLYYYKFSFLSTLYYAFKAVTAPRTTLSLTEFGYFLVCLEIIGLTAVVFRVMMGEVTV